MIIRDRHHTCASMPLIDWSPWPRPRNMRLSITTRRQALSTVSSNWTWARCRSSSYDSCTTFCNGRQARLTKNPNAGLKRTTMVTLFKSDRQTR